MLVQARSRDKVVKTAQGSFNLTFIEMMKGLSTQAVRPLPTELRRYWAVMLCRWENSVSVFYPPHAFYSIFSTLNARHTFVWPLTLDSSLRQCWQRKDLGFIPAFCHSLPPFFRFFPPLLPPRINLWASQHSWAGDYAWHIYLFPRVSLSL